MQHKYTKIKVLGKGGFGEAVLVEEKSTKVPVHAPFPLRHPCPSAAVTMFVLCMLSARSRGV
jgi:hypothetical protein